MTNKKFAVLETRANEVELEILEHGLLTAGAEWNFCQVASPFNRLYLVLEGEGAIRGEAEYVTLREGHAYLIPAGNCYDYKANGYLKKLYIHFQAQMIPGLDLFGRCGRVLETEGLGKEAGRLKELLEGECAADALEVKALLLHMAAYFLRLAGGQAGEALDYSGFERQRRVVSYVEQNLTAALRVEQVARALGVSYFSLSRDFKRDTGMGMKEYMELLLMGRARRYLAATDLRVGEIAERLGFADVFYFTKFFGRYEKVSPREYRRRLRM